MVSILPFIPLGVVGTITWSLWALRRLYGTTYKPFRGIFTSTTSVVVPVYMEDPDVLLQAIKSYLANNIGEVILVVDHKDSLNIENIQKNFPHESFPNLKLIVTEEPGKRPALVRGIMEATGEIVVLSDSDTSWAGNLLEEILKPFIDPQVAGVSARQNVKGAEKTVIWRIENWLLDLRYIDFVPSMSVDGVVNCLSGRTAAYRRSLLLPILAELTGETFLGKTFIRWVSLTSSPPMQVLPKKASPVNSARIRNQRGLFDASVLPDRQFTTPSTDIEGTKSMYLKSRSQFSILHITVFSALFTFCLAETPAT